MSVGGLMFGKRHGEVHTLSTMLKELNRQERIAEINRAYVRESFDRVYESIKTVSLSLQEQVSALKAQNKLLMDYLNVRIESGDRIVPKDNAQG